MELERQEGKIEHWNIITEFLLFNTWGRMMEVKPLNVEVNSLLSAISRKGGWFIPPDVKYRAEASAAVEWRDRSGERQRVVGSGEGLGEDPCSALSAATDAAYRAMWSRYMIECEDAKEMLNGVK